MSGIRCKCGTIIHDSDDTPNVCDVISGRNFLKMVKDGDTHAGKIAVYKDYEAWICPECGRWIVFVEGKSPPIYFKREKD